MEISGKDDPQPIAALLHGRQTEIVKSAEHRSSLRDCGPGRLLGGPAPLIRQRLVEQRLVHGRLEAIAVANKARKETNRVELRLVLGDSAPQQLTLRDAQEPNRLGFIQEWIGCLRELPAKAGKPRPLIV